MKAIIFSIILTCCIGCSVGIQHGLTKDFPRDPDISNGQNLIVIRESQFVGGGTLMQLLVDSKAVAGIASGEYVRLYLEPGLHIISARIFTGRTGYLPIQIPPTGTKFYELSMNLSGELNFLEINAKQATNLMDGKKKISP